MSHMKSRFQPFGRNELLLFALRVASKMTQVAGDLQKLVSSKDLLEACSCCLQVSFVVIAATI